MEEIEIKIPEARIGALIGKNGRMKNMLEKKLKIKLDIDSENGLVKIKKNKADALTFYKAQFIIKAIGRGFSPENALNLLKPNYTLVIIDLSEYASTRNALKTKRGILIGERGSIRHFIENATNTNISVYGKTVSIIGSFTSVEIARKAIEIILETGSIKHMKRFIQKELGRLSFESEKKGVY